jgi:hypothetical protein
LGHATATVWNTQEGYEPQEQSTVTEEGLEPEWIKRRDGTLAGWLGNDSGFQ